MKYIAMLVLTLICTITVYAQQLTTVAIIDITKVFSYYYRETAELRQVESKEQRFSQTISKLREDLTSLQRRRFEAQQRNNRGEFTRLENEITELSQYIQNLSAQYANELANDQRKLLSDDFLRDLQESIRIVSEQNGYTLVLRKDTEGLQWWSKQIDISDLVVERLIEQQNDF